MSKVFEFHFNPVSEKRLFSQGPLKLNLEQGRVHRIPFFNRPRIQNTIFDTFCFFPQTRQENRLGKLYLIGEMKNVLGRSQNILLEIAEVIKEEYYQFNYETPQDCFRAALEKADQYVLEAKKENTDFLSNIGFTAVALLPDFSVSISKAGASKIFLLTGRNIFDIGGNFNSTESPIHTFPNVVEGSLESTDKIIIITEQLFDTFYKEEIFHNLIDIKKSKQIKKLFKQKKPVLNHAFGCCLLIFVKKELPKIFLNRSKPAPAQQCQTTKIANIFEKFFPKPGFLQKNFGKMLFFAAVLAALLILGWLIF